MSFYNYQYDDFLNLAETSFVGSRLVVFAGKSGSGKSSSLRFLKESHPEFKDSRTILISGLPLDWSPVRAKSDENAIYIIDEVNTYRDLFKTLKLYLTGKKIFLATHLPTWIFQLLGAKVFVTDKSREKIARVLKKKGLSFSDQAVESYCEKYKSTYTDLEIIVERVGEEEKSFDACLARFNKFNSIKLNKTQA